ncbi:hypothetical protein E9993_01700 [Labilibacter sediminis]|nr:hypothetical protein E9993_01700 [Labilibacter sediminis]
MEIKKYKALGEELIKINDVEAPTNREKQLELDNFLQFLQLRNDVSIDNDVLATVDEYASFDYLIKSGSTKMLIECKNRGISINQYSTMLLEWEGKIETFKTALNKGIQPYLLTFYTDCVTLLSMELVIHEKERGCTYWQPHIKNYPINNNPNDKRTRQKNVIEVNKDYSDIIINHPFTTK